MTNYNWTAPRKSGDHLPDNVSAPPLPAAHPRLRAMNRTDMNATGCGAGDEGGGASDIAIGVICALCGSLCMAVGMAGQRFAHMRIERTNPSSSGEQARQAAAAPVLAMQASSVGLLDQGGEIENEKAGAAGANGLNYN